MDLIDQDADERLQSATQMKQEYEQRLSTARDEADTLVKNATTTAQKRGDELLQILISLINLLILFLMLKKFLFKPVQKIMAARQAQVDQVYEDADKRLQSATQMKQEYEQRLSNARDEADTLVKNATVTAQKRGDQLMSEAQQQASRLKQKAEEEIEQQKKQMLNEVRQDISELAVDIASKVIEREIKQGDYDAFVDEFIRNVGDKT